MKNHPPKFNIAYSTLALLFVLITAGGSFYWWFTHRPSYIIYQLNSNLSKGSESAAIAEYEQMLNRPGLSPEEEIRVRTALGEFYWKAGSQEGTVFLIYPEDATYEVGRPYIDKAKKEFNRILEIDPNNATAHIYKGLMHLLQGTDIYAIQELEAARKLDPKTPWPLYYLAKIKRERGNLVEARENALQSLAIQPEFNEARLELVNSYAELGAMDKAIKEYGRLSEDFKANPQIRAHFAFLLAKQNYWEKAAREIERALQEGREDPEVHINYGLILVEKGLFDEASGEFAQAANIMPKSAWPLIWQAKTYWIRRESAEIGRIVQVLDGHLPRWPYTYMVRGWAALCEGDDTRAVSAFSDLLAQTPEFTDAALSLARIYLDRGQFTEVGLVLRPLLDKKISESSAYVLLTESLVLQKEFSMARETAELAIKANDRNQWGYLWLGLIEAQSGHLSLAESALRKASALNQDPLTKGYLAWYEASLGYSSKSSEIIEEALGQNPESAELWLLKGKILSLEKNNLEAAQAFKRAVEIKPYCIWPQIELVSLYSADGNLELAQDSLRAAKKINPKNKEVQIWGKRLKVS